MQKVVYPYVCISASLGEKRDILDSSDQWASTLHIFCSSFWQLGFKWHKCKKIKNVVKLYFLLIYDFLFSLWSFFFSTFILFLYISFYSFKELRFLWIFILLSWLLKLKSLQLVHSCFERVCFWVMLVICV